MQRTGGEIEKILLETRPAGANAIPEDVLVESPLVPDQPFHPGHPFDKDVYTRAAGLGCVSGAVLAIDLDDTLLNTNYVCEEEWERIPNEVFPVCCHQSIDYRQLKHPLSFWLKGGWRRPVRERYDSARYPFLRNPSVEAQLRPGALALLNGLNKAGAILVLATLCARRRIEFLFSRLPQLRHPFQREDGSLNIICAEDLARINRELSQHDIPEAPDTLSGSKKTEWDAAALIHRMNPDRFGVKTQIILHQMLGLEQMDLIIDDSEWLQAEYVTAGSGGQFLKIPRKIPFSCIMSSIPEMIEEQLRESESHAREPSIKSLRGYPIIRFEDPLYFPLVHTTDCFSETVSGKT